MKFPHLKGREKLLSTLGFTRHQTERITLVCLHSGLFTRDQVEAFFGYAKSSANRLIQALLQTRISHKPIASEPVTDGRRVRRIFGKQIYGELEISLIRHRRETSLEVTRRRLSSLDFVLDHPELAWLLTEEEKVTCFQQLGIEQAFLPCRVYSGDAKGQVRYFPLRMSVAMGPETCPRRAENPAQEDSILSTIDVYEPGLKTTPFFCCPTLMASCFVGAYPNGFNFPSSFWACTMLQ